jgi:hypothetical protein
MGMTRFSSKWILSHSTWYKFRRSGQWSSTEYTERPHSALGYRPPAPEAVMPVTRNVAQQLLGHGNVENKTRFPHFHTPDDDYGQLSNKALH